MNLNMHKILDLRNVDKSAFLEQCQTYAELINHWNTVTNLLSTENVDNLLVSLINESVALLQIVELRSGARILDVGSGAGIPGFPLKFARPDLDLALVESRRMKAAFLRRVVEELGLPNVTIVHDRIGPEFKMADWTGYFDVITSRGVGQTVKLTEYLMPFLNTNGMICYFKGSSASKDAEELEKKIDADVKIDPISDTISLLSIRPERK